MKIERQIVKNWMTKRVRKSKARIEKVRKTGFGVKSQNPKLRKSKIEKTRKAGL